MGALLGRQVNQTPSPHPQLQSQHLLFPVHTQVSCRKPFEERIPLLTITTKYENIDLVKRSHITGGSWGPERGSDLPRYTEPKRSARARAPTDPHRAADQAASPKAP